MAVVFETALATIFARCDEAMDEHLDRVRTRAEALQSQDTNRLAFTLAEAIEGEVRPAVDEALATYDTAINRPIAPNDRWEEALRKRIELAVDAAVGHALKLDAAKHTWQPLLKAEAPQLRERLVAHADRHFAELRKDRKTRRRQRPTGLPEAAVRLSLFVGGGIVGAILARLVG